MNILEVKFWSSQRITLKVQKSLLTRSHLSKFVANFKTVIEVSQNGERLKPFSENWQKWWQNEEGIDEKMRKVFATIFLKKFLEAF